MPTYEPRDMNTVLDVDIDGNRLGATTAGNSITSKVEEEVCAFLRESGYQVPAQKPLLQIQINI